MADFCKACSEEHFGKDFQELAGITSQEEWERGEAAVVICEGCGPIQVDPIGRCATPDCLCAGQAGHGIKPMTPQQLRDAIVKALDRLAAAADPDSVATLERIFNLLEDDQRV